MEHKKIQGTKKKVGTPKKKEKKGVKQGVKPTSSSSSSDSFSGPGIQLVPNSQVQETEETEDDDDDDDLGLQSLVSSLRYLLSCFDSSIVYHHVRQR